MTAKKPPVRRKPAEKPALETHAMPQPVVIPKADGEEAPAPKAAAHRKIPAKKPIVRKKVGKKAASGSSETE